MTESVVLMLLWKLGPRLWYFDPSRVECFAPHMHCAPQHEYNILQQNSSNLGELCLVCDVWCLVCGACCLVSDVRLENLRLCLCPVTCDLWTMTYELWTGFDRCEALYPPWLSCLEELQMMADPWCTYQWHNFERMHISATKFTRYRDCRRPPLDIRLWHMVIWTSAFGIW